MTIPETPEEVIGYGGYYKSKGGTCGHVPVVSTSGTSDKDPCPRSGKEASSFRDSAPNDLSKGYTPVSSLPTGTTTVTAPNGRQFFAPPGADFGAVYQYGRSLGALSVGRDFGMLYAHAYGGLFDFQRGNNQFNLAFAYASSYAIGIDMAAQGGGLWEALAMAHVVKNTTSGGQGFQFADEAIKQGYRAVKSGGCD